MYSKVKLRNRYNIIMKILVIEDNPRLADRIQRKLRNKFNLDFVENGHEAIESAKATSYDIILLDLGLPDLSGLEVCILLRKHQVLAPILVLTGTDEIASKVELLNNGADDYVTKPFDSDELIARVSALARRRFRHKPRKIINYLDLTMDLEQREVKRAGEEIVLRRKEFDILEYLLLNQGRVLTRDMIMNHAWDGDKVTWNSTIDVHIKHLRDKVDKPFGKNIIKTAYGLGYKVDSINK